ncbi:anti-sigma factor [Nocardia wallacei]|uniref:anti-sigma factor n=1 Tax=Nocardia wallacei TaxID=480035 RepID=UPI00245671B2|nr:anti-sigma factor [Nocardia wallacei]
MPDHDDADLLELAYPYALDALSADERRVVERRLEDAPESVADDFRATVHDLRETLATMTIVDAVPAPPDLEARVQRALDLHLDGAADPVLAVGPALRMRWLAAAAAIVVAVGAGAGIAVYRSQSHDAGEITAEQIDAQPDGRESVAPVTGGGTVTVHMSRRLDAAVVSFETVPNPPADRTYQLWLISPAGQVRSAGVLPGLPGAQAPLLLRFGDAVQLALSIEPAGGSPAPTTEPIAGVPLT